MDIFQRLRSHLQQLLQNLAHLHRALRLVWQSSHAWTAARAIVILMQGILPAVTLYLMKLTIDCVSANITSRDESAFGQIAVYIALLGFVTLLGALSQSADELVSEMQVQVVTDRIYDLLHAKAIEMDLACYENSTYYDALHRAQQEASSSATKLVNRLMLVSQGVVSLVALSSLLFLFHWGLTLVLFVSILPKIFVHFHHAGEMYYWFRRRTITERQSRYFSQLMTTDQYAKEVRLFNLGLLFLKRFRLLRQQLRQERFALALRYAIAQFATKIGAILAVWGSFAYIAYRALQGAVTLGDLVMYRQAFQSGYSTLVQIANNLAGLYQDSLFLSTLYEFLDLQPTILQPTHPLPFPRPMRSGIVFEQVCFQYPDTPRKALIDINLSIAPGEAIALVGENGSGKTTLVKLLCRLYDPTSGRITVDGSDLRQFDLHSLRREIGVIFQDYAKYHLTARENIWFGNVDLPLQEKAILAASQRAGAHGAIASLPKGYDTPLGKRFEEGEELSIGQWQKVALARAFLRDSQTIVLDEPTSALDPKAEYEVFKTFRDLLQGQSAVLITHRLSTVRMADRIYVLEKGRIVEVGTHESLLRLGGTYAHLFETQAKNYR